MKSKPALVAVALALACLVASPRQASSNVVGYVTVFLFPGYSFMANPLNHTLTNSAVDNSLTNLLANCPDGTEVFLWNSTRQAFEYPATFIASEGGWDMNFDLPPGQGLVVFSETLWTNTFVGEVVLSSTNFVAGKNKFSLLASVLPQPGALSGDLLFPPRDGADVYLFRTNSQSFSNPFTYFDGFGWFDPGTPDALSDPFIHVAESFFVQNPGPDANWIRIYSRFSAPKPGTLLDAASGAPMISHLAVTSGHISLEISKANVGTYDVQFSSDGSAWKTVATNQVASVWTSPLPGGAQGYYRLIQP